MQPQQVLTFWFEQASPAQWFARDDDFDRAIAQQFEHIHQQAAACELYSWRVNVRGRLAEIIILDQFSRNLLRGQATAFAQDALALALAQEAVAQGLDQQLDTIERAFLYMPYMHSESKKIQQISLELFSQLGNADNLKFAILHKDIIDRFGRYPHRNQILGRQSTPEEIEFLQQPNSSF